MVGLSVSLTVTVWLHDELLFALSLAVQVIVVVPFGYGAFSGWLSLLVPVMVGLLSQLSVAVAVPGFTVAEHEPGSLLVVMLAGQLIVGGVWSATVNVMSLFVVLPAPPLLLEPSFAVRWIMCGPRPTNVPAAGSCVTVIRCWPTQSCEVSLEAHEQLSVTALL